MTTQSSKKSNTGWYIAAAIIIIIIVVAGVVAYLYTRPPSTSSSSTGTVNITLYAGKVANNATAYGFGNSSTTITSPGPSLTVKVGDKVTVTLYNIDTTSGHNWALVTQKNQITSVVFSAQIGSAGSPVSYNTHQSTTFTASTAGTYYYVCQVDLHDVDFGMWGTFTVTS